MIKSMVSVIIPTYKGSNKLSRAIDSILNQTYKSIEIIVVDDNDPLSKERHLTEKVLSNYNNMEIKYIKRKSNKNGAAARNTGIYYAKGEFICFLDDDDFYLPERIEKSLLILNNNRIYDAVYCGVILTKNNEVKDVIRAEKLLTQKDILLNEMVIGTGSNLFMTRRVLDKLYGFDEEFSRHQDLEFMLRLLREFKVIHLNEALIVKSTNGTNNFPAYKEFSKVKHLYFKKFNQEINQLSEQEKRYFFSYHYNRLLINAFKTKNKSNIEEVVTQLEKYRELTKDEKILSIVLPHKYLNNTYRVVKKIYLLFRTLSLSKTNDSNIPTEITIDEDTKEYIVQILGRDTAI